MLQSIIGHVGSQVTLVSDLVGSSCIRVSQGRIRSGFVFRRVLVPRRAPRVGFIDLRHFQGSSKERLKMLVRRRISGFRNLLVSVAI